MKELYNKLVKIRNKELKFIDLNYRDLKYENVDFFYEDLKFLIDNSFIELIEEYYNYLNFKPEIKNKRKLQKKWKKKLMKKYNKCLITGNINKDLLEACHIIDLTNARFDEKFDENNGIILEASFHKLFDKHYWCINPKTLTIELNKNKKDVNLIKYNGKKVNLEINEKTIKFLEQRYQEFLKK